jgi:hypothetical protein
LNYWSNVKCAAERKPARLIRSGGLSAALPFSLALSFGQAKERAKSFKTKESKERTTKRTINLELRRKGLCQQLRLP